ncbi:MAG: hypothetical protein WBV66_08675 [Pseudolabrys sp.]|jgi:hypothetical protein
MTPWAAVSPLSAALLLFGSLPYIADTPQMRLEMHSFKTTNEPRKLPWWRRLNDFPNPTLDALLTLFGVMVIVAVIYLFSH